MPNNHWGSLCRGLESIRSNNMAVAVTSSAMFGFQPPPPPGFLNGIALTSKTIQISRIVMTNFTFSRASWSASIRNWTAFFMFIRTSICKYTISVWNTKGQSIADIANLWCVNAKGYSHLKTWGEGWKKFCPPPEFFKLPVPPKVLNGIALINFVYILLLIGCLLSEDFININPVFTKTFCHSSDFRSDVRPVQVGHFCPSPDRRIYQLLVYARPFKLPAQSMPEEFWDTALTTWRPRSKEI